MNNSADISTSTTPASAAQAQSRARTSPNNNDSTLAHSNCGKFCNKADLSRAARAKPYERKNDDPLYRPLWIFTLHPSEASRESAIARVNVPYEPLLPGPQGRLFSIEETYLTSAGLRPQIVDLDSPRALLESGRSPSAADPKFHQQMVYAISSLTYAAFRKALGRNLTWGFNLKPDEDGYVRLRLEPHAFEDNNAYYDKRAGSIKFGYYPASAGAKGRNIPGKQTFTCLSHDIVTHEVTHALLDGLRCHFSTPSNQDVLAFHEGLADMVALFQRFSYREVLRDALREARGSPEKSTLLTGIAVQMAKATGSHSDALRTAWNTNGSLDEERPQYADLPEEPHARGEFLLAAVFEAFLNVFKTRAAPLLRLASNGTGVLPEGDLPPDLIEALADRASTIAGQFLTMCIRAVDYCPPVDIEFGDFLRAVITADFDLVPDDPWGYRDAWIDAFARRGIHPKHALHMSEDALRWQSPPPGMPAASKLCFNRLSFDAVPGKESNNDELKCRADDLIAYISQPGRLEKFGLLEPSELNTNIEKPCIKSIRSSHRVGPDGQVIFDLIAEVTQRRTITGPGGRPTRGYGGATIIIGPTGAIRYAIYKNTRSQNRAQRQQQFMTGAEGQRYWELVEGQYQPKENLFSLL